MVTAIEVVGLVMLAAIFWTAFMYGLSYVTWRIIDKLEDLS